jgi:3-phosphoshikimate 1-carboxyvinyltransferase
MTGERGRYNRAVDQTRCGLRPSAPLTGAVGVPPSKSLFQRALVIGALCRSDTWIRGSFPTDLGDDIRAAQTLTQRVGATQETMDGIGVLERGVAPGPLRGWRVDGALDAGDSGTLARMVTAAAGLCGDTRHPILLQAGRSLSARKSPALFACLRRAGVRFECLAQADGWPVWIMPHVPPAELALESPTSSQEVSALLIAAAAWPEPIEIRVSGEIPSRPYLEMTLRMLASFGVELVRTSDGDSESFRVRGPLLASEPLRLEPDASAAAVMLAAGCMSAGGTWVPGLDEDSLQGDVRIVEHLAAFGCRCGVDGRGIHASGNVEHGADLDLKGEPDLAPVLAAVAAQAAIQRRSRSKLRGLGTLRGKESERIQVLSNGLTALGVTVIASETVLEILPGRPKEGVLALDPHGDHRMAFAFALLGLVRDGVDVLDPQCVSKSWPSFWSDMERAGARVVRSTS